MAVARFLLSRIRQSMVAKRYHPPPRFHAPLSVAASSPELLKNSTVERYVAIPQSNVGSPECIGHPLWLEVSSDFKTGLRLRVLGEWINGSVRRLGLLLT